MLINVFMTCYICGMRKLNRFLRNTAILRGTCCDYAPLRA